MLLDTADIVSNTSFNDLDITTPILYGQKVDDKPKSVNQELVVTSADNLKKHQNKNEFNLLNMLLGVGVGIAGTVGVTQLINKLTNKQTQ